LGRLNQRLLEANLRHLISIVAITGEVYDAHMSASLLGFGVTAIYPYLLLSTTGKIL